jgi:hypothetical protein
MDNLTEKEIETHVKRSALCVAACKNLSDDWLRGVIEFGGITADRLDVLEAENKKARAMIREMRIGINAMAINPYGAIMMARVTELLEKSKEFDDGSSF